MLKIAGAVLIVLCSGAMGFGAAAALSEHERALSALCSSLDTMEYEIGEKYTPIPELMELLSEQSMYPASTFYKHVSLGLSADPDARFSDIWTRTVSGSRRLRLEPDEQLLLCQLGYVLGRYCADIQLDKIHGVKARFAAFSERAAEIKRRDSKMRACLGLAAGLSAVIILL